MGVKHGRERVGIKGKHRRKSRKKGKKWGKSRKKAGIKQ